MEWESMVGCCSLVCVCVCVCAIHNLAIDSIHCSHVVCRTVSYWLLLRRNDGSYPNLHWRD